MMIASRAAVRKVGFGLGGVFERFRIGFCRDSVNWTRGNAKATAIDTFSKLA